MRNSFLFIGAAMAAVSLAACNKPAETKGAATPAEQAATPDANPAMTVPTPANEATAADFVPKAAASDMFEIEAAKLAQKMSTNADIKKFAAEMIKDHTASTASIKNAVEASGQTIAMPTTLPDDLQQKLDDLKSKSAADFDKAYIDGQIDAHQDALNLMQRYAQDGDVPAIKTAAATIAPTIQKHLDMAKAIKDGMK